jgi:hypothetical protein
MHIIPILIVIFLIYLAFHAGHSHAKYRANRHRGILSRIWVSIPGPFGTRISKRL